jgi:hypothetical protein
MNEVVNGLARRLDQLQPLLSGDYIFESGRVSDKLNDFASNFECVTVHILIVLFMFSREAATTQARSKE